MEWLLKSCPQCSGDLYNHPYPDSADDEYKCLQCGKDYKKLLSKIAIAERLEAISKILENMLKKKK